MMFSKKEKQIGFQFQIIFSFQLCNNFLKNIPSSKQFQLSHNKGQGKSLAQGISL